MDSARSQTTDRTGMYSLCAPHPPMRRPAGRPSRAPGQRVPVDPVPLRTALHAGQAGSRFPLPAEDARPQISRDTGYRDTPGGTSAAAFVPDVPERIGVPSP